MISSGKPALADSRLPSYQAMSGPSPYQSYRASQSGSALPASATGLASLRLQDSLGAPPSLDSLGSPAANLLPRPFSPQAGAEMKGSNLARISLPPTAGADLQPRGTAWPSGRPAALDPQAPRDPKDPGAWGERPLGAQMDVLKNFPVAYTLCCFIVVTVPLFQVFHVGRDPNVHYWILHWCDLVLALPLLICVAHVLHVMKRRPYKPAVLVSLLVPCLVLLVLGDCIMTRSSNIADQLFSTDCDTFRSKRSLEDSWQAANVLYTNCLVDTVALHNISMEEAVRRFRVADCEEYPKALQERWNDWHYLAYLEQAHHCAGWCSADRPIWSFNVAEDSCSIAVSQVFQAKVKRISLQVVLYTTTVLIIISVLFIGIGPWLRHHGIDW